MSDYGSPCILCGHAATTHGDQRCGYFFGQTEWRHGKDRECDCRGYCPTVEVAQLRGFLPGPVTATEEACDECDR